MQRVDSSIARVKLAANTRNCRKDWMMFNSTRPRRLLPVAASLLALAAGAAQARPMERFVLDRAGVRLEISAPRADIVRIRAGRNVLPEDASWAVSSDVRARHAPLDVTEANGVAEIGTGAVRVRLDEQTLAITVTDASGRVILADAPGGALRFHDGGFTLRKAMPEDEHFFGLGDKAGPLDRRNEAFTLWNTDNFGFGVATDPLYKAVPFVMGADESGHAYGLFLDDTFRTWFDFGKSERDNFDVGAEGGPVDYYVMAGPDPRAVEGQYAYLTGAAPLAPQWSLGFQQSHWSYMTQAEAQGIADRLRADRIPADALYLDIDYQDRLRPFTVNRQTYPDLPGLVSHLKAEGMHLVLITDLHIAYAPNQGYAAYDNGTKQGIWVRKADGSTYVAPVWPGDAVFPDFSRPKARDYWGTLYRDFVKDGVAGFWNDMDEPAIFKTRSKTMPLDNLDRIEEPGFAPRDATQAEMHNVFGMLNSRATYEGVLKLDPDQRPFVLTRASYAGGQRYAATWTGDNSSSWAHLKLSVSQLNNLGLSGFAYSGDDIGGFAGEAPSPDLLTRWIEIGAFNPIFRDHYQKDKPAQEVWVHGPEQEAIRRRYIEERYRLMPYIYGLAEEDSRDGMPIMRPVFLNYPMVLGKGERLGETQDQFMLGADLLIAPSPTMESPAKYTVNLPGAGWYDYWTGNRVAADTVEVTPRLDVLPVYVRPGAIIPKQPLVESTMEMPKGPLELHVYPGDGCEGSLYFDDGSSFAYTKGVFLRQSVSCDAAKIAFSAREGSYRPWWTGIEVVIHGWTGAAPVARLDGKAVPATVDAKAQTLTIALPDMAKAGEVRIAR
jgi:alpha-glucosidase